MELYGSLSNISGSVSASYFTGSYIGDGAGLYNLPASGVTGLNLSQIASGSVTASVTPDGFNVNTSTSITGSLNVSGTVLSQTTPLVSGSSQINITGTTGYSTFSSSIATTDSNQESRLSSIETSTGSLNSFTSSIDTTIKNKLNSDGVISGSSQILNGSNVVSSSTQVTAYGFATTGSNLYIGTQTHSGSILPSVDNAYDLGSAAYQWRDVYISSGSLYIDGTKVIGSTAQELTITTDTGQSIKILEGTTDSIILQTADGDIELKSSGDGDILLDPTNGKITLKGTVEVLNGNKIQSSVGGTPVVFANDIVVSGSIDITGTIEGINLTDFSSSLNTRLGSLESSAGSLNSFTSSTNSRLLSIETSTSSLNSHTSSANSKFTAIESVTSSFTSYSGTTNGRLNAIETSTGSLNTHSSSTNSRLTSIETSTSSLNSFTSSINTTIKNKLDGDGVISGSVQVTLSNTTGYSTFSSSIASTDASQDSKIDSLIGKTGSYATTGSNTYIGNQIITGSLYVSQDLVIGGSSSIQHISSSVVNIGDNIITVNAQNPSIRFGGLAVIDSGSSPQVSGSMLFDSVNNQWIFVHQNQTQVTSSVLLMGPETYNNLGGESYITANRLVKSTGIEHLTNSNISDDGTTVTILSNAIVNGTFNATGTTIVSGSSQINHNTTTNYIANEHINHTSVSISAGNGLSGGGDISATRTLSLDTASTTFTNGVKTKMNTDGVVSGSSQITYSGISGIPSGIVSGSSQVSYPSLSNIPSGIVSGSGQISFGSISGVPSGLVSGSSQVSYPSLSNIPSGIVSGSSQVSYPSLSNIPGGIVSGSGQVDLTATTNYSTGIKTRLNAEGVISGSSQVTGISNAQLTNSSFYIGTTSISLGRASASQTLTGVSIDGNAATATSATSATSASSATNSTNAGYLGTADLRTIAPNSHDTYKLKFGFTSWTNNNTSPWADYLHLRSYSDNSGGSDNLLMFKKNGFGMRLWQQTYGSATAYSSYVDILDSSNHSYAANMNQNVRTSDSPTFAEVYTNGWFRNNESGEGLYNQATGMHWYSDSANYLNMGAGQTSHGIRFRDNHAGTIRGYLYYNNSSEKGFLNSAGSWSLRVDDSHNTQIYGSLTVGNSTSSDIYMTDTDENTRRQHCNSGRIGFLSTSNSWGSWCATDGSWYSDQSMRAPIFYDSSNTTYYCDPNSYSSFWGVAIRGDQSSTAVGNQIFFWDSGGTTTSAIGFKANGGNFTNPTGNGDGYNTYLTMDTDGRGWVFRRGTGGSDFTSAYTAGWILNNGIAQFNGSVRAPIFYDSNDTAYYLNPAGGSRLRNLYVGDSGDDWSDPGGWGTQVRFSNGPHVKFVLHARTPGIEAGMYVHTPSSVYIGSYTSHDVSLMYAGSRKMGFNASYIYTDVYLEAAGSLRAPIFYDSNDTGYYIDPNSTSRISSMETLSRVVIGGRFDYNAYNAVGSTRLHFGGGDADADNNYYIGTNLENYGGNYTKLDLRWHTGIRMGAQASYGGIRFFNNEDLSSVLFSIGAGDGNVRSHTNLYPSASGSYDLGSSSLRWANVYTNDLHLSNEGKDGGNIVDGTTGNWTIQEGNENLYIINNKNGKKFKIDLTEIV